MTYVELDLTMHNCISTLEGDYFVLRASNGDIGVIDARCPHRGGPLQLGERNWATGRIICPWHGTQISEERLLQRSLPITRIGNLIQVELPTTVGKDARPGWRATRWCNPVESLTSIRTAPNPPSG